MSSLPSVQQGQREGRPSHKSNPLPTAEILDTWKSCIPSSAPVHPNTSSQASPEELEFAPREPPHMLPIEQGGLTLEKLKTAMNADAKVQEEVIPIICEMLELTVEWNEKSRRSEPFLQTFEGTTMPTSVASYVKRILKYSRCSTCCVVVGLMYLERMKMQHHSVRLTPSNLQRLLLVATMEASKYLDDFYYSNWHWAQIGGITLQEINNLELDFLFELTFDVCVTPEQYKSFVREMIDMDDKNIEGLLSYLGGSQAHIIKSERRLSLNSPLDSSLTSALEHIKPKGPQANTVRADPQAKAAWGAPHRKHSLGLHCDDFSMLQTASNFEGQIGHVSPEISMSRDVELFKLCPKVPNKKEIVMGVLSRSKMSAFKIDEDLVKQSPHARGVHRASVEW